MYRAIARNRRYSIVFVAVFVAIITAVAVWLSIASQSPWPAILILGFAAIYTFFQLRSAVKSAAKLSGCIEVTTAEEPELCRTVENLAIRLGMPTPTVCIIESAEPNALALGMSPDKALVAATRGLLNLLTSAELEGVMAHEMSHIRNYDSRVKLTIFALIGSVAVMALILREVGFAALRFRGRGKGANAVAVIGLAVLVLAGVFAIIAFLVGPLVNAAVSREREYLADASAFEATRYADGLATALAKLEAGRADVAGPGIRKLPSSINSLFFVSPERTGWLSRLLSSHPSTVKRVARLHAMSQKF